MERLELGCGEEKKFEDSIGVDIVDLSEEYGEDFVQHDLEETPYPFESEKFDEIYLHQLLEHIENRGALLAELERILKPGGKIEIDVPYYTAPSAHGDVTHVKGGFSYEFHVRFTEKDLALKPHRKKLIFSKRKKMFWNYLVEPLANQAPFFFEWSPLNVIFKPSALRVHLKKEEQQ
ncbi:MAG: methyltransferase domain-containing protein [Candidatus Nanohaloarchaea archaeon]